MRAVKNFGSNWRLRLLPIMAFAESSDDDAMRVNSNVIYRVPPVIKTQRAESHGGSKC